ncbi:MAG: 30S ribosomal protein S27e [Candidatus Anstonellales archaeon]
MSRFIKVRCKECSGEQVTFTHSTMQVKCLKCGAILMEPMGGKGVLVGGEVVEEYD